MSKQIAKYKGMYFLNIKVTLISTVNNNMQLIRARFFFTKAIKIRY